MKGWGKQYSEKEIFEDLPVPKAVAVLVIPTIISQMVTMIYNLADTFFVGQLGDPVLVAAVSLSFSLYNMFSAVANLFGIGGGSLISRLLGAKREEEVRHVSAFSFYLGLLAALAYSLVCFFGRTPILRALGASDAVLPYAKSYLTWVIGVGGVPTMLGLMLAHLLRSEGHAREASLGMMLGGVANIVLDPVFIFVFHMSVAGAAIATFLSNILSCLYLIGCFARLRGRTHMSLDPRLICFSCAAEVLYVGLPAAMGPLLASCANMTINKLASAYGDVPIAAFGIDKKLDMFPLRVGMGISPQEMASSTYRPVPPVGLNRRTSMRPLLGNQLSLRENTVITTRANQKLGRDTPLTDMVRRIWSMGLLRNTAETTPKTIPSTMAKIMAKMDSSKVAGKYWRRSASTGRPVRMEVPRSPWSRWFI